MHQQENQPRFLIACGQSKYNCEYGRNADRPEAIENTPRSFVSPCVVFFDLVWTRQAQPRPGFHFDRHVISVNIGVCNRSAVLLASFDGRLIGMAQPLLLHLSGNRSVVVPMVVHTAPIHRSVHVSDGRCIIHDHRHIDSRPEDGHGLRDPHNRQYAHRIHRRHATPRIKMIQAQTIGAGHMHPV